MTGSTREALLKHGALLFARSGVEGVTTRQLHEAAGARNESALHYHFGDRAGLLDAILAQHFAAIEERRAVLVEEVAREGRTGDVRALVRCLAQPMADDLGDPIGRAHLRLVANLNHPAFAFDQPFRYAGRLAGADSGNRVVTWLAKALPEMPPAVRTERLVALREQLIALFGQRARLLDDDPQTTVAANTALFLENLLDMAVAALTTAPTEATLTAQRRRPRRPRR